MRLIGAVRLSHMTDESTSPERQHEQIGLTAKARGDDLIATTEDLDVSGAVSPFEREGIGAWLTDDRAGDWDGLIVAKLDRLTRSLFDFQSLMRWCQAHGKTIISVSEGLDFGTPVGKLIANVLIMFAEFERERMGERRSEAHVALCKAARWGGGSKPYGYQARQLADGWELTPDPVTAPTVRRMVADAIDGQSMSEIARRLDETGTAPQRAASWSTPAVKTILKSRALRGEVRIGGRTVRDGAGEVVRYEPLITEDDWSQLQAALAANSRPHRGSHKRGSLLLRVAFCPCGAPLYMARARDEYRYYRCASHCGLPSVPAAELEAHVTDSMLALFGSDPLMRRISRAPGSTAAELAEAERDIADLEADRYEHGLFSGTAGLDRYRKRMTALEARQAELEASAGEPECDRLEPTGDTVGGRWGTLGVKPRGDLLRKLGVRVAASRPEKIMNVGIEWGDLEAARVTAAAS